ncbi:hypothetical protein C1H46_034693 [Malus baccata]|uniref:Uncharacterized protein n=1 Tax=Malus baccata TaxID=106549 RepID=A0A540L0B7_MALBA|nr:hypothetical protein C1H46_034693 [Malus baccata]
MGTEVQSKMYFPGYYSIQNLSSNVGHGSWSLLHENTNLKNGQQYEVFLTRPVIDGFHGRDKDESIFRHQLNELHRLYERQKDLMNDIKSKELIKQQKVAGSQSTFSSFSFPTGDDRKSWSFYGRQSTLSTCISHFPYDSIGKTLQNSGVPSQSRVGMKDHKSSASRVKKP